MEWRGPIGHCEDIGLRVGQKLVLKRAMSKEKSPGVTRSPNFLAILHGVRRVVGIQERDVLCGSFGVTLAPAEDGQNEAQSCDGEHVCTSRSSRCGRSGWFLGVQVG